MQNQEKAEPPEKKKFIDPTSNSFKIHLVQMARKKRKKAEPEQ